MTQDFRCPFCLKEGKIIKGFDENYLAESRVMIFCKKHKLILFEKKWKGGIFSQESYWEGRVANTSDFRCENCKFWGINKYSKENDDRVDKACSLNIPLTDNPSYNPEYNFRMGHATACKKFKHKEIKC